MDHLSGNPGGSDFPSVGASVDRLPLKLVLTGELDIATATELDQQLTETLAAGRGVELDLSRLTFIDSTGLGVLIRRSMAAARDGVRVTVRRTDLAPQVRRLIELTDTEQMLWPQRDSIPGPTLESS